MKFVTAMTLLATATSAFAMIVVNDPGNPQLPLPPAVEAAEPVLLEGGEPGLEERQVPGQTLQQAATPAPTQYPSITTIEFESTIAVAPFTTTVFQPYTQLFSATPQQWPSPGVGQIGYGTVESKRDAAPVVTPAPVGVAGRLRL